MHFPPLSNTEKLKKIPLLNKAYNQSRHETHENKAIKEKFKPARDDLLVTTPYATLQYIL